LNALTTEGCGGKRQAATLEQQRPVAGVLGASNALATKACGRSAWCKQPRGNLGLLGLLRVLRLANGRLERPNNRGLWRQTAGCNALATKACGRSAWCKQPRRSLGLLGLLRVLRLANGRLERPNNRGLWKQTAGCNALATKACGRSAWCTQPRGAKKNKFHTCGGPRCRPCLGEGRGRRIYIYRYTYRYIEYTTLYLLGMIVIHECESLFHHPGILKGGFGHLPGGR